MALEIEDKELERNKNLFYDRMVEDGKLVSPIDLSLEATQQITLGKLNWVNLDVSPVRMKLTNTGETVIVSAKWATERPYLVGGPLRGNYVFSQIHFHWGSDEHEGSEHTVRGICYPMEMHIVFYKTRYLTQEAALKNDDGVIIVVYLIRLSNKTTPGLHWLVSNLDRVVQPHTSTPLSLSPLSSLLVPFNQDYLVYWGSLQTSRCAHTMLWIVSRAALAITVDDLNVFRSLLNGRKEPMNKNFRGSNAPLGRTVFHINPSEETKQLLLPGSIDPPGQVVIVNYSQMPSLDKALAKKIFSKGDNTDESDKKSDSQHKVKTMSKASIPVCEGNEVIARKTVVKLKSSQVSLTSNSGSSCRESQSSSNRGSPRNSPRLSKVAAMRQARQIKRRHDLEKMKREGVEAKERDNLGSKPIFKSKLPVPMNGKTLESSLAKFFQRPDSAPTENIPRQVRNNPRLTPDAKKVQVTTSIPRPLGRNAGRLDENSEIMGEHMKRFEQTMKTRPTSSHRNLKKLPTN